MAVEAAVIQRVPTAAARMAAAASQFLGSLDEFRQKIAHFPFQGDERFVWNYRPDGLEWNGSILWHEGLRLINMTDVQKRAALALMDTGLSTTGAVQARDIMELERHLRETERHGRFVSHAVRDVEIYSFAVFGEPGGRAPWGWRVGGHHIGLQFTIVDGECVASTPLFFGANPAEVRHGSGVGLRTLPQEEDLARALLKSLGAEQKGIALISPTAPADIITDAYRAWDTTLGSRGLTYGALNGEHRTRLVELIRVYIDRASEDLAAATWSKIERAGLEPITFAWSGGEEKGQGHYYSIKGPTFLIEYDCTQDGANHIHSTMRDTTSDWGQDALAAHYRESH
ncbi:MAG: DUF3500 domain-containing protein [Chloroflexota bacterium]